MSQPRRRGWAGISPTSGPLGRRLLLWFLLISLSPLVVSNGLGYLRSEAIIEGLVQRYLSGISDLQARHVTQRLEGLELALSELATRLGSPSSSAADGRREITEQLEATLGANDGFEAVYVFDQEGEILASAPLPPADLPTWIGPALAPPFARFEVRREDDGARFPYVRLAIPLPTLAVQEGTEYVGALVTVVGEESFLKLPEHTAGVVETVLVDTEGRPVFVSHPHGHVDYGARFEAPLLESADGAGLVYDDRIGVPVLGTIVSIPNRPWRLINEVPVSDALVELHELRGISLWLASVLALVVIASAWVISGRIVAPIGHLVSATRRLGGGELSARVDPGPRDEIGELADSFNRMAAELEETSRRVAELHEREMERAAQLATVGELAAGVAHEIKNPIAGIAGGVDLISKRVPEDPELSSIVHEMRRQTARVDGALRDLLSFARPVQPQLADVDVEVVLDRAIALTKAAARSSLVTVRREPGGVPTVRADAELLGQCLVNVLINAIQASSEGQHVVLETAPADGGVTISISDEGVGIPPDRLSEIFRPFFTTKHRGTGLGLSITAGVVERHGGRIWVESEPGLGSTFHIWLPTGHVDDVDDGASTRSAETTE